MAKPFRQRRLTKTNKKRAKKAARLLPHHMQDVAFSLADNRPGRRVKGTFGPASPVRRIDPKDYKPGTGSGTGDGSTDI